MNATAVHWAFLPEPVEPSRTTAGAADLRAALATRRIRTYIVCAARMPGIARMLAAVLTRVRDHAARCDAHGERQSVFRTTTVIMRIAINVLYRASAGSLRHAVQLLEGWKQDGTLAEHECVIFASPESAAALRRELPDLGAAAEIVVLPTRGATGRLHCEQWRLPRELVRRGVDVLLCLGNVMPYLTRIPVVAFFQNAAPFCDTVTPASVGWRLWLRFALLGRFMRATARRATVVVFLSRYFRDLFVERFHFPADRGLVIPHAGGPSLRVDADPSLEARLGIRRPYVLCVSHLNPYKNIVELVEGFARATRDLPPRQLVLAGMANFPAYLRRIQAAIDAARVNDRVLLTGELPHRQALSLVAGCEAFVFPSTCENCPISLIEALSGGAPVASSNVGAMPEIIGNAALVFDPADPADIGHALRRLLTEPALREEMRRRAVERARTFMSPEAVARATLDAVLAAARTEQR